jgi:dTDP-glucose 4,6-dehydratase
MKIVVTGGAGFIGSNFIRYVLKAANNHAIINYDKLTYAANLANLHSIADHPSYRFIKADIGDAGAAETAMRGCDTVVHSFSWP